MDTSSATRGVADRGVGSVQFLLASALALLLFVTLANVVVVQYGRGAIRSALEQGARAGAVGGVETCQRTAGMVLADLLGGQMGDGLELSCWAQGGIVVASASVSFDSWTPLTPDFEVNLESRAVAEP